MRVCFLSVETSQKARTRASRAGALRSRHSTPSRQLLPVGSPVAVQNLHTHGRRTRHLQARRRHILDQPCHQGEGWQRLAAAAAAALRGQGGHPARAASTSAGSATRRQCLSTASASPRLTACATAGCADELGQPRVSRNSFRNKGVFTIFRFAKFHAKLG